MQMSWRVIEAGRFRPAGKSELHDVGNLVRQIMEGEGGDQANDGAGNLAGNNDQVGLGQRRPLCQAIESPPNGLDYPMVSKPIERWGINSKLPCLDKTQDSAVVPERLYDRVRF